MNKASIVDAVHDKLGGTKVQAEEVVDPATAEQRAKSMTQEYAGTSQRMLTEVHDGNPDPELQAEFQELDAQAQVAFSAAENEIHISAEGDESTPFDETQRLSALRISALFCFFYLEISRHELQLHQYYYSANF